jgi:hypothetical protein
MTANLLPSTDDDGLRGGHAGKVMLDEAEFRKRLDRIEQKINYIGTSVNNAVATGMGGLLWWWLWTHFDSEVVAGLGGIVAWTGMSAMLNWGLRLWDK